MQAIRFLNSLCFTDVLTTHPANDATHGYSLHSKCSKCSNSYAYTVLCSVVSYGISRVVTSPCTVP
jgi:hypothetical protein